MFLVPVFWKRQARAALKNHWLTGLLIALIVNLPSLLVQGIATSIDALSVGFTISDYNFMMALVCAVIIAVVTFIICMGGLKIGKTLGTKLAGKAAILGGVILIFIGVEIFITGIL